jgi:hypothetical protein
MNRKRRVAQDKAKVIQWFKEYDNVRKQYGIKAQNIWDFDESGFRTACPPGVDVWIPVEIQHVSVHSLYKKQKIC